ncbi:hypothetical protein Ddye_031395 [Dipteronia dyeriana]|uniref:Ribosomal protein S21 n=1 Tax=Dipteronia dyeriana TaxID=168575 RepID=A0AAD9WNM6_9ROSI|nr:hypothetical protein Ddye_031395 [Dipteronia dyeriana]
MNSMARRVSGILTRPCQAVNSLSLNQFGYHQVQQWRGIRVKVFNGNLEQALSLMQRKMTSSGIERLIKRQETHHIKNSEKRVLARKNLQRRLRSEEFSRKIKAILLKKVRVNDELSPKTIIDTCPSISQETLCTNLNNRKGQKRMTKFVRK